MKQLRSIYNRLGQLDAEFTPLKEQIIAAKEQIVGASASIGELAAVAQAAQVAIAQFKNALFRAYRQANGICDTAPASDSARQNDQESERSKA